MNRFLAGLLLLGAGAVAITTGTTFAQDSGPKAEANAQATLSASIEANEGRYHLARYTQNEVVVFDSHTGMVYASDREKTLTVIDLVEGERKLTRLDEDDQRGGGVIRIPR